MNKNANSFVDLCITFLLVLGTLTLIGWLFEIDALVKILPHYDAMTMGSALCFILSGLLLFAITKTKYIPSKNWSFALIGLLILVSSAYLIENFIGIKLGIDLAYYHQKFGSSGLPAVNSLIGFFLFALGSLAYIRNKERQNINNFPSLATIYGILLASIGVVGLLGYFLNLRDMYNWNGLSSMAVHTSLGMLVMGAGLCALIVDQNKYYIFKNHKNRILAVSVIVMLVIGVGIALLSFYLMQKRVEVALKTDLATRAEDQSAFIYQIIAHRSERSKVLSKTSDVSSLALILNRFPNNKRISEELNNLKNKYKDSGFDQIDFELLLKNHPIIKTSLKNESLIVGLKGKYKDELYWNNGYFLISRNPVEAEGKLIAYVITKQRLTPLDTLLSKALKWGETVDLVICGDAKTNLNCFPNRKNPNPFSTPKLVDGQYLPMAYAVDRGDTNVVKTSDYRGIEVLAAYTPIGDSGLGLVEKIDVSEIYSPTKVLMLKIILVTGLLLLFGYLIIRKQLTPLISLILEEQKNTEIEKARFIAATEGGLDNFYIFEAVRDLNNVIIDFKCLFINSAGAKLINKTPEYMVGKLLLQEVPINREKRLFDKYKYVIETGNMISEELSINDIEINASWVYWQVIKLGDGMAITSRDITEKKRVENALIKADQLHSAILESASYSIIATDVDGIIISMNKAAERMLWYSEEELAGKFSPEIIHDKEEIILRAEKLSLELGRTISPGFEVFVAKAIDELSYEDEWTYVRKDGSKFPVKLSVTVLKEPNGNIYGFLGVAYDISEQKRVAEYITHIALHDVLTGLPNRALFDDRVKLAIEGAKRNNEKLGIALLDLDHFKYINDSLGHHIGDKLLQVVSSRLASSIRPTDTVARMGGDEFAFLFPNIAHPEGSHIILHRLLKEFIPKVDVNDHILHATPSIGMAIYPDDGDNLEDLLKNADTAMYRAKELGRNGYQIFDKELRLLASVRINRELELREAIENNRFELYYQPQINLDSYVIVGLEALIRWQKSPGVFVSPAEFIPLAEETGLILPIGEWVIRQAIMQAKQFEIKFGRPIRMAVNVSPRQFKQTGLVTNILNTLKEFDVAPNMFEIEITENSMMDNVESTFEVMNALTESGVHIALDDFGTGYSSLSYLSRFKFNRIKIDQSFIKNCLTHSEDSALVRTIITMSKSLGVGIIAEGVETRDQLDFIKLHKCGEAQGYFIGRPAPASLILDSTIDCASL